MCDTLVALPAATARGATLFAKNSDRERNEAQGVEVTAAARHEVGEIVQLTYIAIPQAEQTHACLLARPFWMWGAEMGANEHGVAIGNEAVHSVRPAARTRRLTGMDLVRLGLERAATAAEAVKVITDLLERHGQGGDCGHLGRFYYHNSFMIADAAEAFVLETVDRWWALERVTTTRAISNALSIGAGYDAVSPAALAEATTLGWTSGDDRFDFAGRLSDHERDRLSHGSGRCARGSGLLAARADALTALDMQRLLRDHGPAAENDSRWSPERTVDRTICMHAAEGARRSQTVGSLVSELRPRRAVHWVTAGAAPCLSLFKPVVLGAAPPPKSPPARDVFDPEHPWWRHEMLHRAALPVFAAALAAITPERDALELSFHQRMDSALASGEATVLATAARRCWLEAAEAEQRWLGRVRALPRARRDDLAARASWGRLNAVAKMPAAYPAPTRASP